MGRRRIRRKSIERQSILALTEAYGKKLGITEGGLDSAIQPHASGEKTKPLIKNRHRGIPC